MTPRGVVSHGGDSHAHPTNHSLPFVLNALTAHGSTVKPSISVLFCDVLDYLWLGLIIFLVIPERRELRMYVISHFSSSPTLLNDQISYR